MEQGRGQGPGRDKVLHLGQGHGRIMQGGSAARRGGGRGEGGLSHINDEIIVSIAFNCCQCKFYANIFRLALDS